ncbi:helix-turn-helix domain-containing protein [Pseudarthrobacter sp. J1738]|uniref:helix-turn-helix domain-containing protein n=1 Tax=Pseudarthrobacter sp. J1738 TaxID=3420446 RepID=UPI003D2B2362
MVEDWMTTEEAGELLGVTRPMVRKLLKDGTLLPAGTAGRALLVDRASVLRHSNRRKLSGRSWNAETAWAALDLITGGTPRWIDATARFRLKKRLMTMAPTELAAAVSTKDEVKRYRLAPAGVVRAADYVLPTGTTALKNGELAERFGLAEVRTDVLEGYLDKNTAPLIVDGLSLVEDPKGKVVLRIVGEKHNLKTPRTPDVVVAVDLMESSNSRERAAGEHMLARILEQWKAGRNV